jgi:argonaute-like protein implicated in RNA metabolism and viral defense
MNPKELHKAKNPDLRASLAAMYRAAEMARQIAIQTNTAIVIVRDGKLVRIPAEQLREESRKPI